MCVELNGCFPKLQRGVADSTDGYSSDYVDELIREAEEEIRATDTADSETEAGR